MLLLLPNDVPEIPCSIGEIAILIDIPAKDSKDTSAINA